MRLTLRDPKSQLSIEIDIIVPGQPVSGVQLAIRQRHHLCETGRDTFYFVNHALGYRDILIALDLHRTIIDGWEALAGAFAGLKCERTAGHFYATNINVHSGNVVGDISESQLSIQILIVVPGQPVSG